MIRNYWVISDTHFGHANFLKFLDNKSHPIRDFSSVEEMDETMIQNWNSVVDKHDYVYHCGDVTMDVKNFVKNIRPRLNGSIRLIVGNHDGLRDFDFIRCFKKVKLWHILNDFNIILTHFPLHPTNFKVGYNINAHGHIHQNDSPMDKEVYYENVSVEKINYTPVNLEVIRDKYR